MAIGARGDIILQKGGDFERGRAHVANSRAVE